MNLTQQIDFNAVDVAPRLLALADDELDELPFGVIEMDLAGTVLRYNTTESGYSGLPRERVVGRHFFREVAPCSNNRRVAQRYAQDVLDETIAYTFALRMQPVPVTLRMIKPAGGPRMLLLVHWT